METIDWGYYPKVAFVKADPNYAALEASNLNLALSFVKFIQKVCFPQGQEGGSNWGVPNVPDGAVFWWEKLTETATSRADLAAVKRMLLAAIGANKLAPDQIAGGPLDRALGTL
jgi:hypothetical protein